jgi:hypothetical protein
MALSISYEDMTSDVDPIPIINKEDESPLFNISHLIRLEIFHTGF